MDQGTYQLKIEISQPVKVNIGKLGVHQFQPGVYIYTGRASRGLAKRLLRHQRKNKSARWHIDYLTNQPAAKVTEISIVNDNPEMECAVNQSTIAKNNIVVPVKGFGSTDCAAGCPAHLVRVDG
ncbi:MAG: GIY-YIG nuclease family protein [FCB group bacterium]|nr:GIY-YIG nuclease family protein [FCB group bacterium]